MDNKLKKGIVAVLIANVINVFFSLATNFLLPKYLSVESYAGIKTFQLYVSYVGLLHFGYIDGMYLKYGGVDLDRKVGSDLSTNLSTIRILEIFVTVLTAIVAIGIKNEILLLFAVSVFPLNISNYYKFLYQATGNFKLYGNIMNLSTIATFAANMGLLFLAHVDADTVYIVAYVILYYLIWIILEINFRQNHVVEKGVWFSWSELKKTVADGFFLTLGNLASMMQTGMDRWFVKFLMTVVDFAQYSFAVSVENFLNLAITPITTTFYNFFCREHNEKKHRKLLGYIYVFAALLPSAAFGVKWILEVYLQKYNSSLNVVFLLFAAEMFSIIIRSFFVNLYKVQRRQTRYFLKLVSVLIIGFIFNCIFYALLHNKESFAIGTLLSGLVWYIISLNDFKYLHIGIKHNCFLTLEMITFLVTGLKMPTFIGLFSYLGLSLLYMLIFLPKTLGGIIRYFQSFFVKLRIGRNE